MQPCNIPHTKVSVVVYWPRGWQVRSSAISHSEGAPGPSKKSRSLPQDESGTQFSQITRADLQRRAGGLHPHTAAHPPPARSGPPGGTAAGGGEGACAGRLPGRPGGAAGAPGGLGVDGASGDAAGDPAQRAIATVRSAVDALAAEARPPVQSLMGRT